MNTFEKNKNQRRCTDRCPVCDSFIWTIDSSHAACKNCNRYITEKFTIHKRSKITSRFSHRTSDEIHRDILRQAKVCTREFCEYNGEIQPFSNFYKHKRGADGRSTVCKKCHKILAKPSTDKYNKSAKAKRTRKKYSQSARGKLVNLKYRRKTKGMKEQKVRKITYEGKTLTLREWSRIKKIPLGNIKLRLQKGMPIEEVLQESRIVRNQYTLGGEKCKAVTYKGETKSIKEWSRVFGINYHTLINRINANWPLEKAFNKKADFGNKKLGG